LKDFYDRYWSREIPPPTVDPLTPTRRKLLWSVVASNGSPVRKLLECGCGDGDLVAEAAARGIEATGMEISSICVRRAGERFSNCKFILHSVEERPWPISAASCDVVVSFEVVEHLLEPRQLIAGAYDALAPGGHLALTTPYHGRLKNLALAAFGFDKHFSVEGEHIRFFTDSSLIRLVEDNGFQVERVEHFGRFQALWAGVFVWARKK
jgi:2-polyprenyl-3-methyl-5-hydroxy-6-metoxy-1,4-benzoquinol methylase